MRGCLDPERRILQPPTATASQGATCLQVDGVSKFFVRSRFGGCALPRAQQLVSRHYNLAIVEPDVSRGSKPKCGSAGSDLFNREQYRSIVEVEHQPERYFTKLRIHLLDPILEPLRRECSHIAHQNGVKQMTHGFTLFLGVGMHSGGHIFDVSMGNAEKAPS